MKKHILYILCLLMLTACETRTKHVIVVEKVYTPGNVSWMYGYHYGSWGYGWTTTQDEYTFITRDSLGNIGRICTNLQTYGKTNVGDTIEQRFFAH